MDMYILCIFLQIQIHVYTPLFICACVSVCTCFMRIYICVCCTDKTNKVYTCTIHLYICSNINLSMHVCPCTYMCVCVNVLCKHMRMYMYVHVYYFILWSPQRTRCPFCFCTKCMMYIVIRMPRRHTVSLWVMVVLSTELAKSNIKEKLLTQQYKQKTLTYSHTLINEWWTYTKNMQIHFNNLCFLCVSYNILTTNNNNNNTNNSPLSLKWS